MDLIRDRVRDPTRDRALRSQRIRRDGAAHPGDLQPRRGLRCDDALRWDRTHAVATSTREDPLQGARARDLVHAPDPHRQRDALVGHLPGLWLQRDRRHRAAPRPGRRAHDSDLEHRDDLARAWVLGLAIRARIQAEPTPDRRALIPTQRRALLGDLGEHLVELWGELGHLEPAW